MGNHCCSQDPMGSSEANGDYPIGYSHGPISQFVDSARTDKSQGIDVTVSDPKQTKAREADEKKNYDEEDRKRNMEIEALKAKIFKLQEASTTTSELQKQLEAKTSEHTAQLQAQQDALNRKIEEERKAAAQERDSLNEQLEEAKKRGAADVQALQTKLRLKAEEHASALFAHTQEKERLQERLAQVHGKNIEKELQIKNLAEELSKARQEGSIDVADLEAAVAKSKSDYKEKVQNCIDSSQNEFETERTQELEVQLGEKKQRLLHMQRETEELQKEIDERIAQKNANKNAPQEALQPQLDFGSRTIEEGIVADQQERNTGKEQHQLAEELMRMRQELEELQTKLDEKNVQNNDKLQAQHEALQTRLASERRAMEEERERMQQALAAKAQEVEISEAEKQRLAQELESKIQAGRDVGKQNNEEATHAEIYDAAQRGYPSNSESQRGLDFDRAASTCASAVAFVRPVPPPPRPSTFEVTLQKTGDEPLGIKVVVHINSKVEVTQVLNEGAVPLWNNKNPTKQVVSGDLVAAVNGVSSSANEMVQNIRESWMKGDKLVILMLNHLTQVEGEPIVAASAFSPCAEPPPQSLGASDSSAKPWAATFEVKIQKTGEEKLGITLAVRKNIDDIVIVRKVSDEGAVPSWNDKNHTSQIASGDWVTAVNGVSKSAHEMVQDIMECWSTGDKLVLCMVSYPDLAELAA